MDGRRRRGSRFRERVAGRFVSPSRRIRVPREALRRRERSSRSHSERRAAWTRRNEGRSARGGVLVRARRSMRRLAKTARTLRGPRWRSRRAASRACSRLPCLCRRIHPWRSRTRGPPRASSSPRGTRPRGKKCRHLDEVFRGSSSATWRNSWCQCDATSDALAAAPGVRHFHSRRVSSERRSS